MYNLDNNWIYVCWSSGMIDLFRKKWSNIFFPTPRYSYWNRESNILKLAIRSCRGTPKLIYRHIESYFMATKWQFQIAVVFGSFQPILMMIQKHCVERNEFLKQWNSIVIRISPPNGYFSLIIANLLTAFLTPNKMCLSIFCFCSWTSFSGCFCKNGEVAFLTENTKAN